MTYTIATKNTVNRFQPYSELQKTYGVELGRLTSEATIEAITALGFSISQGTEISALLNCGNYYSEVKRFPVLVKVLQNLILTEWDKKNLIALLAQTI